MKFGIRAVRGILRAFDESVLGLLRELRWSYLPPLMVYLAAGAAGLSAVVGTFFVKEYLGLSAAFLSGLAFWAGLPWTLKMPLGHLVDLIWRWKAALVYLGAALIAVSIAIMYGLLTHTAAMTAWMSVEAWFVTSALLAPTGYVVQDVVADAMTVEAVPVVEDDGTPIPEHRIKSMHTTMQTLGRFAIVLSLACVAGLNITLFDGVESLDRTGKTEVYADIYLLSLAIPVLSVTGVALGAMQARRRMRRLRRQGVSPALVQQVVAGDAGPTRPNWWIFGGSLLFVGFSLGMGLSQAPLAQEIVFVGAMAIIAFLMARLFLELAPEARRAMVGTALIIFVFRAVPLPGPGATWFEIDVLGFDQRFIAVLGLVASVIALLAMVLLRPVIARRSIAWVVVLLTLLAGALSLPNIGLYYGVHHVTAQWSDGIVDARFIAVIDTALESPLAQVAMIPMLAWIARNAPAHLKATFFAVMASFSNLALSTSSLGTRHLNELFVVAREVRDPASGRVTVAADYGELGTLLIVVALLGVVLPLLTVFLVQRSRLRTTQ
jgi:hypothetical protein